MLLNISNSPDVMEIKYLAISTLFIGEASGFAPFVVHFKPAQVCLANNSKTMLMVSILAYFIKYSVLFCWGELDSKNVDCSHDSRLISCDTTDL